MAKDKNSNQDADLEKYRSLSGVSLREMNFGLWLAQQRRTMLKIFTGFLIAVCAFFLFYSSYNYIIYFMSGDPFVIGGVPLSPRQVTTALEIAPVEILPSDGHYDLAVKIKNPNDKFLGTFHYCFTAGGRDILCSSGFILPGEEKYLLGLGLGQDLASSVGASLKIVDVSWLRLDAHQIPDWSSFAAARLNLAVADLDLNPAAASGLSDKVRLNYLQFSVSNQTPYGYYEVPLDILLYNGAQLVGAQSYRLTDFLPGAKRAVNISWPGRLDSVTRTEVRPDINILDDSVYLKYQGAATP
jgi:hypothetical protein